MQKIITRSKHNLLKKESELLNYKIEETKKTLSHARSHGDLKENAAYHIARDELKQLNDKKNKIDMMIVSSDIIIRDSIAQKDFISFGARVTVTNNKCKRDYLMLSTFESDIDNKILSLESPFGKSIINKKENDTFTFNKIAWKIQKIQYAKLDSLYDEKIQEINKLIQNYKLLEQQRN